MNDDEKNVGPQLWIDPALEARVVAGVLGETSAFEAAELERILAENPELAIFKRRIEAVHALVGAAVRPEAPKIQLSPGRRQQLLEKLGARPARPKKTVKAFAFRQWWSPHALSRMVACLAILAFVAILSSLSIPAVTGSLQRSSRQGIVSSQQKEQPDFAGEAGGFVTAEGPAWPAIHQGQNTQAGSLAATPPMAAKPMDMMALPTSGDLAVNAPPASAAAPPMPVCASAATGEKWREVLTDNARTGSATGQMMAKAEAPALQQAAEPAAAPESEKGVDAFNAAIKQRSQQDRVAANQEVAEKTKEELPAGTEEIRNSPGQLDGHIQYGAPVVATSAPQATAIKQFTGGWGKGVGEGTGARSELAKNEDQKRDRSKDEAAVGEPAKPAEASLSTGWDSLNMFRGVNVISNGFDGTPSNSRSDSDASSLREPAVPMEVAEAKLAEADDSRRGLNKSKGTDLMSGDEVTTSSGQSAKVNTSSTAQAKMEETKAPLQEARDFYATGRYDLAAKRYEQVLSADPTNIAARRGMEQLNAARTKHLETASNETRGNTGLLASANWERPVRKFDAKDSVSTSAPVSGDTPIARRLNPPAQDKERSLAFQNEIKTAKQPFSTFSLHVSDVSFQLAKDALARGTMPDPDRIRAEEFYNAFDCGDPAPAPGEEVACRIEQCAHPFLQQRDLVRIALKVAAAGRAAGQPLRLTILLDTSGSMEREDRAASVRRALGTLASLLGPNDRVTLVGFARTPRLLAEQVPGDQAKKLVEIAAHTPSEGGTNLEQALALAAQLALKQRLPAAQNRIVLLTDGAANLGNADPARLAREIEKTRQQGISFDACGVGANGLNDEMLEALTRKGDGRYYFLNRPEDADAGFARQLAGALRPAAENVKVQVVFNPARVGQYRLIGFEKHLLKKEDFRNDKVQAAELAAEEAGIALYQVQTLPEGEGELGEVFVRFRDPANGQMVEHSWTMPYDAKAPAFDKAPPSMQLAVTAALLAEKLRGDSRVDLNAMAPVITNLRGRYPHQAKVGELIRMFERMRQ